MTSMPTRLRQRITLDDTQYALSNGVILFPSVELVFYELLEAGNRMDMLCLTPTTILLMYARRRPRLLA